MVLTFLSVISVISVKLGRGPLSFSVISGLAMEPSSAEKAWPRDPRRGQAARRRGELALLGGSEGARGIAERAERAC